MDLELGDVVPVGLYERFESAGRADVSDSAIYGLARMPPLTATPSLRILCTLPLVFNALSFYTAIVYRLRLAVVTRRGCQEEFHQVFFVRDHGPSDCLPDYAPLL